MLVLADRAYQWRRRHGPHPYYGRDLPSTSSITTDYNCGHARLRAPGERAFARLKSWRLLRRARWPANRIGVTVAAVPKVTS
ncbi:hypothetical protein KJK32_00215 [Streptomyces sp. JCM17656]|nr:hypothetical protein KJK32_00215 [Streptomyces sp. JCM17656]